MRRIAVEAKAAEWIAVVNLGFVNAYLIQAAKGLALVATTGPAGQQEALARGVQSTGRIAALSL